LKPSAAVLAGVCCGAFSLAPALAETPVHYASLADLSLEQLGNVRVTSVSGREEPLRVAPASIYVITRDDIRRSAATNLPEALRLAPNLHVAQTTAGQYAISARGFNNSIANKLQCIAIAFYRSSNNQQQ
jgi:iron complex outermembrane receptor protein